MTDTNGNLNSLNSPHVSHKVDRNPHCDRDTVHQNMRRTRTELRTGLVKVRVAYTIATCAVCFKTSRIESDGRRDYYEPK